MTPRMPTSHCRVNHVSPYRPLAGLASCPSSGWAPMRPSTNPRWAAELPRDVCLSPCHPPSRGTSGLLAHGRRSISGLSPADPSHLAAQSSSSKSRSRAMAPHPVLPQVVPGGEADWMRVEPQRGPLRGHRHDTGCDLRLIA